MNAIQHCHTVLIQKKNECAIALWDKVKMKSIAAALNVDVSKIDEQTTAFKQNQS